MCLDLDRLKWLCFLADFCHTDEKEGNDYNDRLSEQFKQMPDHFFSSSSSSSYFFRSSFILFLLFCPRNRSFNVAFLFLKYTYIYMRIVSMCSKVYIERTQSLVHAFRLYILSYILYFLFFSFFLILVSFSSAAFSDQTR